MTHIHGSGIHREWPQGQVARDHGRGYNSGESSARVAIISALPLYERMFHVRPETGEPIYRQLVRQITHAITTGALKPGDRLPTVRNLAAELVVNPNTVARAYRELDQKGLIDAGPRRGTFVKFAPPTLVARERVQRLRPHLQGLIAEARVLGFSDDDLRAMLDQALEDSGQEPG